MPVYQVDVEKRLGTEFWTNVYHVRQPDLAAARSAAAEIAAIEKGIHHTTIQFTRTRTAPFPGPSEGTIDPVGGFGANGSGSILPLFCVLRADFPAESGRPSRKYYRIGIQESEQDNGVILEESRLAFQAALNNLITVSPSLVLVDVDNQLLASPVVFAAVGMRQLRRGSKRRATPVLS